MMEQEKVLGVSQAKTHSRYGMSVNKISKHREKTTMQDDCTYQWGLKNITQGNP